MLYQKNPTSSSQTTALSNKSNTFPEVSEDRVKNVMRDTPPSGLMGDT